MKVGQPVANIRPISS